MYPSCCEVAASRKLSRRGDIHLKITNTADFVNDYSCPEGGIYVALALRSIGHACSSLEKASMPSE
jgi:hypothetical protein